MTRNYAVLLAAGVLLAGLSGCASKFNRQNFGMIREGVDEREDVRMMIGKPTADMNDVWIYDDIDHSYSAQIFFADDGRVIRKEWIDAKSGEWEGDSPWIDEPKEGEVRERETRTRRYDD